MPPPPKPPSRSTTARPPTLATAARARATGESYGHDSALLKKLSKAPASSSAVAGAPAAATGALPSTRPKVPARTDAPKAEKTARVAKKAPRIPISHPTPGGHGGPVPDLAQLVGATPVGVPPSFEPIRATERVVASMSAEAHSRGSASPAAPQLAKEARQFTQGVGGPPMSAQAAWASAAEGERRQSQLLADMASHSAQLYRTAVETI